MVYDLIIIGLGAAGMNAALYAKRSGLNVLVFESSVPGGLINKTDKIENFPGFVSISGPDLASNLFIQFNVLGIPVVYDNVCDISVKDSIKLIETKNGVYKARSVIIASGRKPKMLGVKGEEELIGRGISYCHLCDGNLYKNKIAAVIGGGNSAISGALYLSGICKKVYLVVRKEYLKADKIYQDELLKKDNVEIIYSSSVEKFVEKDGVLHSIILTDGEIEVDGVFVNIGYEPVRYFYEKLGIADDAGFILVDSNMKTSVEGIFAAGDTIKKDIYQIITAQSEGAIAALSAYDYLMYG